MPAHAASSTELPFVFVNVVSTVNGVASLDGKASGIGSAVDRGVMRTLRSKADAVMIGGGTIRAERLSLGLDAEDPRSRPLAVVLSNTGDVPLERNLILDRRQRVLLMLAEGAPEGVERRLGGRAETRRVRTNDGTVDLANALETLRSDYGVGRLLVEGGPTLNRSLISSNLADELFVTLAPMLLGSGIRGIPPISAATRGERIDLRLLSSHTAADELFLRYAIGNRDVARA